jgi:proteic killer suppression protein
VLRVAQHGVSTLIKSFRHKGIRRFYETGNTSGIQNEQAKRLRLQLAVLDTAQTIGDIGVPGYRLHPLKRANPGDGQSG